MPTTMPPWCNCNAILPTMPCQFQQEIHSSTNSTKSCKFSLACSSSTCGPRGTTHPDFGPHGTTHTDIGPHGTTRPDFGPQGTTHGDCGPRRTTHQGWRRTERRCMLRTPPVCAPPESCRNPSRWLWAMFSCGQCSLVDRAVANIAMFSDRRE